MHQKEDSENLKIKLELKKEREEKIREELEKKKYDNWEKKKHVSDQRILRSKITGLINSQGLPPCKLFEDNVVIIIVLKS